MSAARRWTSGNRWKFVLLRARQRHPSRPPPQLSALDSVTPTAASNLGTQPFQTRDLYCPREQARADSLVGVDRAIRSYKDTSRCSHPY